MTRLTVKEAAKLTGIPIATLYQQIQRGTSVGQFFSKDKHGHWRGDQTRIMFHAREYKRKASRGEQKIGFRVNDEERKIIEGHAKKAGLSVAEWCRVRALSK